jgi:hypothetical protein
MEETVVCCYGIINPHRKPGSKRQFKYRTADGSSILVDYITKTPTADEARHAHVVLEFLGKEDNGVVGVDECLVATHADNAPLTTAGILTCTAIGLSSDTHKLLAHLSPKSEAGPVLFKARGGSLTSDTIKHVYLWQGVAMMYSLEIAYRILKMLGIERDDPRIVLTTVGMMDEVQI